MAKSAKRPALEVDGEGEGEEEKRAVLKEEWEDEEALFAQHDASTPGLRTRGRRLQLLPLLCCILACLAIVAIALAVVLSSSKPAAALEKCVPMKVPMPDVDAMSLAEKIGQIMQVEQLSLESTEDVTKFYIGSVISGGGGAPRWGNSPSDWADMVDDLQAKAQRTRLRVPLVYGVDAVHGHNNVYGAVIFPHHVGMGASRNPQLMQRVAAITARETVGTGVRWNFSPAVSVCRDPRWGRCYESFSSVPSIVNLMALPEIIGNQVLPDEWPDPGKKWDQGIFIAATAKHYVADGGTVRGKDRGDAEIPELELRDVHLPPYITAVTAGVMSVMASYSSWNGVPMSMNKYLLTDVLRQELEFQGVVVSDWGAVQLLPGNFSTQVMSAINAGIDMVMLPSDYKGFSATLTDLVNRGLVSMERIDEAVQRILDFKQALSLFNDPCAHREFLPEIGSEQHRLAAREAVRETLVCLKNSQRAEAGTPLFPLGVEGARILVVGRHANDIGLQCGGWTISWQGRAGPTTKGTTILDGFRQVAAQKSPGARVSYQEVYDGVEEADYGIVVVGEEPYAEYYGDSRSLSLNDSNVAQVESVCSRMPCMVVLVVGRPLDVASIVPMADAVVVAWLPGSEGAGVADVIIGGHDFKGRLPRSWFKSIRDDVLVGELFTEGYGLDKSGNLVV